MTAVCGRGGGRRGVNVVLKGVRLAWDHKVQGLYAGTVRDLEDAHGFVLHDVQAALGHRAVALAWRVGAESVVEFENVRFLVFVFVEADDAVAFATKVHDGGIGVPQGDHGAGGGIDGFRVQWLVEILEVPYFDFAGALFRGPTGEHFSAVVDVNDFDRLDSLVGLEGGGFHSRASVAESYHFVFTTKGVLVALDVPYYIVYKVVDCVKGADGLAIFDVPYFDRVVGSGGEEGVVGRGVEAQ